MFLRQLIQTGGWRLPLKLLAILIVAQFGKQAGLAALGQTIPPVSKIIVGMVTATPFGLLLWTVLAWGMIYLVQVMVMIFSRSGYFEDHFVSWRELVSIYLLASLTHVLFTAVSLTSLWLTGSELPAQFSFLRGVWSFLITVDAAIATVTFFLLTAWYTVGSARRLHLAAATK